MSCTYQSEAAATAGPTRRSPISTRCGRRFAGQIVALSLVAELVRPRSDWPQESRRYGLGFQLAPAGDAVFMEGYDAGVSFLSLHQPSTAITDTILVNWSEGACPMIRLLDERLGT